MVNTISAIDLSLLPEPEVVEQIDYEVILKAGLDDFHKKMEELEIDYPRLVESDPAYKLAEVFAYREMLVRKRANDSSLAVLLAYAKGKDLDNKAAERNLVRRVVTPATATTPAIYESDTALRKRIQLAPEGYTTAGSEGSYQFHTMNADVRIKDMQAFSPSEGVVSVYLLSHEGDGAAADELLNIVDKALNAKQIRPLTDHVNVYSASIVYYQIDAILETASGPDANTILENAAVALTEYTNQIHALNEEVTLSGIYHALHQAGVKKVTLNQPLNNIPIGVGQAGYCSAMNLSLAEDR
ncbi:baseplate assembly protein [Acinetobacter sp. 102]|uniref:baseplate assembly protein n=1 Tax=Acinetobacter sp. 102 TaxID=3098766 RepID=UPI00300964AC